MWLDAVRWPVSTVIHGRVVMMENEPIDKPRGARLDFTEALSL